MATNLLTMSHVNIHYSSAFSGSRRPFLRHRMNNVKEMKKVTAFSSRGLKLSRVWREIQGMNNWENLVEPLDSLLKEEIIRYGEFVAACYKGFELDSSSKRYLHCKFGKSNFLEETGLGNSGYQVTKYIYATPEVDIPTQNSRLCGRWIGYIAISNDEESEKLGRRDMIICFRGTITNLEWLANLMSSLKPARLDPHNPRNDVKVQAGILSLYTTNEKECKFGLSSCRQQLLSEVSRILTLYKTEEMSITIAGHSMGSSLGHLLAYDISELGLNVKDADKNRVPVTVFSFGGPRVGNSAFKQRCERLGVKVMRVVNVKDPITKLPGVFFNEGFKVLAEKFHLPWSCSCYAHVGVELLLNFSKMYNPSFVHDLEAYINLLKCHPSGLELSTFGNRANQLVLRIHSFKVLMLWEATNGPLMSMSPALFVTSCLTCYYFDVLQANTPSVPKRCVQLLLTQFLRKLMWR